MRYRPVPVLDEDELTDERDELATEAETTEEDATPQLRTNSHAICQCAPVPGA